MSRTVRHSTPRSVKRSTRRESPPPTSITQLSPVTPAVSSRRNDVVGSASNQLTSVGPFAEWTCSQCCLRSIFPKPAIPKHELHTSGGYGRSPRYNSQRAEASRRATTPSTPMALRPSEMGQKPRTFPSSGLANVTSRRTVAPASIISTRGMAGDVTAGRPPTQRLVSTHGPGPGSRKTSAIISKWCGPSDARHCCCSSACCRRTRQARPARLIVTARHPHRRPIRAHRATTLAVPSRLFESPHCRRGATRIMEG
jgi:hypothetical protein